MNQIFPYTHQLKGIKLFIRFFLTSQWTVPMIIKKTRFPTRQGTVKQGTPARRGTVNYSSPTRRGTGKTWFHDASGYRESWYPDASLIDLDQSEHQETILLL